MPCEPLSVLVVVMVSYSFLPLSSGEERWLSYSIAHSLRGPLKQSLSFEATSARDFAEILCCLDYKLYRRIPVSERPVTCIHNCDLWTLPQFSEFCIYAHAAKPTDETPRIEECIRLFNGVTTWVVSNILREITMVKRAAIVDKFIECTRVGSFLFKSE